MTSRIAPLSIGFVVMASLLPAPSKPKTFPLAGQSGKISFGKQILPILKVRCGGCHCPPPQWWNQATNHFDSISYQSLLKGGDSGPLIIPGDPDNSFIFSVLKGKVGTIDQMPLFNQPLPTSQVNMIKQWVKEGAVNDEAKAPELNLTLQNVEATIEQSGSIKECIDQVRCRVPFRSYVVLKVFDSKTHKLLASSEGPVLERSLSADASDPVDSISTTDRWITWDLSPFFNNEAPKVNLPEMVDIQLSIQDYAGEPADAEFGVDRQFSNETEFTNDNGSIKTQFIKTPISLSNPSKPSGQFNYRLRWDSIVHITITSAADPKTVLVDQTIGNGKRGSMTFPWDLKDMSGQRVKPGLYIGRFTAIRRKDLRMGNDVCATVVVTP